MCARVGVVLPVYRQESHYIIECIDSLQAQRYRDFRLVVVLDGSDKDTAASVGSALVKLTVPNITVSRPENRGIAYSLNEGFSLLSECEYLTWVSSDNRQGPLFLSTLTEALGRSPKEVVLAYSLFYAIGNTGERTNNRSYYERQIKFMPVAKNYLFQHNFIGPSFMFKKDAYIKAGRYNSEHEKVEDYEFWLRLLETGREVFIPKYLMEYRYGGKFAYTTLTHPEEVSQKMAWAVCSFLRRYRKRPEVTIIMIAHNHEQFIAQAIKSVLTQTFSNFHLVIVNNGSKDKTRQIIAGVTDQRVLAVHLSKMRSKGEALNLGLRYVLGESALVMDGSDWVNADALGMLVQDMKPGSVRSLN